MKKSSMLLSLIAAIVFTGCFGPKSMNKWVDKHYEDLATQQPRVKGDYLAISSPLVTQAVKASTTTKETRNWLPLLFYWQFDYINTCKLNPNIPVNKFITDFQSYAGSKGLKQKLDNNKLELVVTQIPASFQFVDKAHLIWIIYAFGWDNISYRPENKDLVVDYKILKDNVVTKTGTITIPDKNPVLYIRTGLMARSNPDYLDQYDESIKQMSREAVTKLMAEL